MSPPEIERLTQDHNAALERLHCAERKAKRASRWIAGAVITALATAGAGVVKHYLDLRESRRELEAVAGTTAVTEANADHRWHKLDETLTAIRDQLAEVSKQAAINATAIEYLTADQRWIRDRAVRRFGNGPKRRNGPNLADLEAPPEAVQAKKAAILDALE